MSLLCIPRQALTVVWCSAQQVSLPILISLPGAKQAQWHIIRKVKIAPAQISRHPHPNKHPAASLDRLLCLGDGDNAGKNGRKALDFTVGQESWLSQVQDEIFPRLCHKRDPKAKLLLQQEDFICFFFPLLIPLLIPVATFPCTISPSGVKKRIWASRAVPGGILWDPPSFVASQLLDTESPSAAVTGAGPAREGPWLPRKG